MSLGSSEAESGVVELRRYSLHPAARDTLIDLFERELVETQEAVGIRVLGTFRDLDDPDSFVWLRGFRNMPERGRALEQFYGGPVWARYKDAANAAMIDSDDVLLLRPVDARSRLALDRSRRPPAHARVPRPGCVSLGVCSIEPRRTDAFVELFMREVEPELAATGARVRACFVTEHSANNYPALPVREGVNVFVWMAAFPDEQSQAAHAAALDVTELLRPHTRVAPHTFRLTPTPRSLLPD